MGVVALMMAQGVAGGGGATDPYFANVSSLLHFNGADLSTTFTDQTGKTWTFTGNAQIDTAQFKYGGASGLFDGTNDYGNTPSHADFDFGSGDFTVECWVRFNSLAAAGNQGLIVRDQIGGTRGWLLLNRDSVATPPKGLCFTVWVGATPYAVVDPVSMTTGVWVHVAGVRDGGTLRLYKNGVQVDSLAISGSVGAPTEKCVIGTLWGVGAKIAAADLNGWIDDVRITKGVCRYPSGTTFTPPTAQFPDS